MFRKVLIVFFSISCALASEQKLAKVAQESYWKKLIYLVDSSSIISDNFYISNERNSYSELIANIEALKASPNEYICRFPARAKYLIRELDLPLKFEISHCRELANWLKLLDPTTISVVYPTHSLESSLAVFSHTFIKFNKKNYPKDSRLNVTLSFAAEFNRNESILVLGFKGIFGGYMGKYGTSYFYDEVNKYSEKDARDIYEYELALTPAEINQMLLHVWEVKDTQFTYYFIKENCSYYILTLLDIARPTLNLVSSHAYETIPSESIKTIVNNKDLVLNKTWVPSRRSRQKISNNLLSKIEKVAKKEIYKKKGLNSLTKKNKQISEQRKILLLDSIIEETKDEEIKSQALSIRSKYTHQFTYNYQQYSQPINFPHNTHGSTLIAIGTITAKENIGYNFRFRFALHDFLDPREGYSPEASVNCLDLKLKFFDKKVDENFSSFDLIKMYALKEFSMESKKLSWKGISRFSKNAEFINFENSINIGPNYNIKTTNIYMMAGMFTHVSHFFERGFNINHGGIIGFNSELTHKFRVSFEYITQKSIYSNTHQSDMDLGLSVNLQKNQTLEAHYLDKSIKLANSKRGELTWNFYF